MKNNFWNTIKNGCFIFTIITVVSYTIGMLISSADKAYIPSLKSIYIYLFFSILFSFACNLFKSKKISPLLKLIIHFVISGALFFCVIVLGGGLTGNGFVTIVLLSAFTILYLIFAIVYILIAKKKETKKNNEKQYNSVFN